MKNISQHLKESLIDYSKKISNDVIMKSCDAMRSQSMLNAQELLKAKELIGSSDLTFEELKSILKDKLKILSKSVYEFLEYKIYNFSK